MTTADNIFSILKQNDFAGTNQRHANMQMI